MSKGSILKSVLLIGDVFFIHSALFFALVVRHRGFYFFGGEQWGQLVYHFSLLSPLWLLLLFTLDFYEAPYRKKIFEAMREGATFFILAFGIGAVYFYLRPHLVVAPKTILLLQLLIFTFSVFLWRYLLSLIFGPHILAPERETKQLLPGEINEAWFKEYVFRQSRLDEALKRVIDVFAAALGMLVFLCLFPLIAAGIKFTSPGHIFYTQKRVGKDGGTFVLAKFRTMFQDAEKTGPRWAAENDERVTKIGYILRRLHLDELPQAINLLRGDLSLVGPRPERPEFTQMLEKEIPHYNLRHLVKPGIFGWAQLNFPYGDSVADAREKLKYDLYYIKNRSIFFDLLVVLKSLKIIVFARGQ